MILKNLKKIKSNIIWYFIIKILIKPIYDIFWSYIINFHGKLLFFFWFMSGNKKFVFKNDKYLHEDESIKYLVDIINKDLSDEKVKKILHNLRNNEDKSINETNSEKKKFKEDITNKIDDKTKNEIYNFCLSKKTISIISSYLKVLPILNNISIYINVPKDIEDIRGSMNWHRDDFGYRSMDIFIPITDINEDNGPFFCVREKEKLGRFINYSNEIKNPIKGNRGKIIDKNFRFDSFDQNKVLKFDGKRGKALFIDSFNCYHKGGHCLKNYRIMLRITYSTVDTYLTNEDYNYHNIQNVKNKVDKNLFNNFILKKKSNIIKKLNIYKFLVRFYRVLSYKI